VILQLLAQHLIGRLHRVHHLNQSFELVRFVLNLDQLVRFVLNLGRLVRFVLNLDQHFDLVFRLLMVVLMWGILSLLKPFFF
jgi:hypothetical protein